MADYLSISGIVSINPSLLNGNAGVLEGIAALRIRTEFRLKKAVAVQMTYDENGNKVHLRYESKTRNAYPLKGMIAIEARGKNLKASEEEMRSQIALQLALYFAAEEYSPRPETVAPIGKELSDFLN